MAIPAWLSPGAAAIQQYNKNPQERSGFGKFLFGTPEKFGQMSRYSPENQQQFNSFISQLLQQYMGGGQDFSQGFEPIAEQARAGFQSKTLPSIMERLTSLGGGGGRSNASFMVPTQAAADLELGLGAQRAQYGQQQQQLLQNLLGLGQQEPFYQPRTPGFGENLGMGLAQGFGAGAGMAAKAALAGGI